MDKNAEVDNYNNTCNSKIVFNTTSLSFNGVFLSNFTEGYYSKKNKMCFGNIHDFTKA